jgi:hypothetical protein
MKAARTSETSVTLNVITWRYIREDSKLHTRIRENLKSQTVEILHCIGVYYYIYHYHGLLSSLELSSYVRSS